MENNKRNKILLAIVIIILVLAFVLWVMRTSDENVNLNENSNEVVPVFTPPSANVEQKVLETATESPTEFSAINLAKSYVARFGSWSTDNQGANLNELLPLSTSKMKQYISNIELNLSEQDFRGVTTKSISAKIVDIDDNNAEILVNTQKIETDANLKQNVYYQDVEVELIKSADKWLVDQVVWK